MAEITGELIQKLLQERMDEFQGRLFRRMIMADFGEKDSPEQQATKAKTKKESSTTMATDTKAEPNRFKNTEVGVSRAGTKIVLPSEPYPMRYDEAIDCIQRIMKEEETVISVYEEVNAFPFDGAHAFMLAMKEVYGWATPIPTPSFFGPIPPRTLSVEVDFGVYTQVIWGDFAIPGIEGKLTTSRGERDGRPIFVIAGQVKKRFQAEVGRLADLTRKLVAEHSIYRGKAISFKVDDDGDVDFNQPPRFLNLALVNEEELIFSDAVAEQVQTNLFTPVEHTKACRELKVPLKRGVLLEGPYGTGKTLAAFVTAKKCVKTKEWTFILIDRVAGLDDALTFAKMYQPAVVFAEDIDREMDGERDVEMDDILNTIDGIGSKGTEIITILTSNNVKGIDKAMLRPGRLDAIITVNPPDAKAAQKLVRLYARGILDKSCTLQSTGKELDGQIPAVIREVVERAKLYAISRTGKSNFTLMDTDLTAAARGMKNHLDLMAGKQEPKKSKEHRLGAAFAALVEDRAQPLNSDTVRRIEKIEDHVEYVRENLN